MIQKKLIRDNEMQKSSVQLIESYYDAFNKGDMKKFINLLDENVIHDINQGGVEVGKDKFEKFMNHMNHSYKEQITDLVIMANANGSRAAAEFIVAGEYILTDGRLPPANHQKYTLPAGAFFKIENGKIKQITMYYNLKKWIELVSK